MFPAWAVLGADVGHVSYRARAEAIFLALGAGDGTTVEPNHRRDLAARGRVLPPSPSQYDDDDERERVKASQAQAQAMLLAAPAAGAPGESGTGAAVALDNDAAMDGRAAAAVVALGGDAAADNDAAMDDHAAAAVVDEGEAVLVAAAVARFKDDPRVRAAREPETEQTVGLPPDDGLVEGME